MLLRCVHTVTSPHMLLLPLQFQAFRPGTVDLGPISKAQVKAITLDEPAGGAGLELDLDLDLDLEPGQWLSSGVNVSQTSAADITLPDMGAGAQSQSQWEEEDPLLFGPGPGTFSTLWPASCHSKAPAPPFCMRELRNTPHRSCLHLSTLPIPAWPNLPRARASSHHCYHHHDHVPTCSAPVHTHGSRVVQSPTRAGGALFSTGPLLLLLTRACAVL